jgi:hypothetical protein
MINLVKGVAASVAKGAGKKGGVHILKKLGVTLDNAKVFAKDKKSLDELIVLARKYNHGTVRRQSYFSKMQVNTNKQYLYHNYYTPSNTVVDKKIKSFNDILNVSNAGEFIDRGHIRPITFSNPMSYVRSNVENFLSDLKSTVQKYSSQRIKQNEATRVLGQQRKMEKEFQQNLKSFFA